MLILTRRVGETILIGDDIRISVLRVKGNQVRLGVDAPKSVSVQREELQRTRPAAAAESVTEAHIDTDGTH